MSYHEYRFITSTVSPFISAEELVKQIKSNEPLNWEVVADIAGTHSIIQALYPAFIEKDVVGYIPNEFLDYAQHLSELNQDRNRMMKAQLIEAVSIINKSGIKPLLMKGAAHLILDTFSRTSDRLLTDLDILVPADEIKRISEAFIEAGYTFYEEKIDFIETHHHYPPLIKQGECAMIELHRELMFSEQQHIFPTKRAWENTIDITLSGNAQAKVLNPTYRVFLSFLHNSLVDSLYLKGYVEIRQLHELARTQFVYSPDIDWGAMQSYAHEKNVSKQLDANLYAASKFMGIPEFMEFINNNVISAVLHYYRVCLKLKYSWFETLDAKLYRRKKRMRSRTNLPSHETV